MRILSRFVLLPLAIFMSFGLAVRAQTFTTSLQGTVFDKTGAPIPKAKVTLVNPASASERSIMSGAAGEYSFSQLAAGTYQLNVEAPGFRKYEQKAVQLLVNTPATINVTLEVGAVSETVEVTGEATLVNTTDASLGNAFNERQVKELPLEGRNVPDLLSLQAGVTYTGPRSGLGGSIDRDKDTRNGAVNGAHSDQSNVTLDGVDVNDDVNGYAFTSVLPVTLDSVQEFRVATTNYNADEGRSSGAQVSLITKSGTNKFHGSLYEYMRNTATSANDYFVKQAEAAAGEPNTPPKLIRNIFGVSVGGPLIKDRLFFFANYEGARQREEQSVLRIVPSDNMRAGNLQYVCDSTDPGCNPSNPNVSVTSTSAGNVVNLTAAQITGMDPQHQPSNAAVLNFFNSFPEPNDFSSGDGFNFVGYRFRAPIATDKDWYIARLDYKITASGSHSLFWRGALRNDTQGGAPYLPGQQPEETFADYSKGFTAGYTALLRSNLINNFRWGFTRQSFGDVGNTNQPVVFMRDLNDNQNTDNSTKAFVYTSQFTAPVQNFVDDLSWQKGKHSLQFGVNVAFLRNPSTNYTNSFSDASTNASWLQAAAIAGTGGAMDPPVGGFPAVDAGFQNSYDYPLVALIGAVTQGDAVYNYQRDGSVLPQGAPVSRRFASNSYELYAQDSWKIKPNLTFTYGLRYSLFSPPWETNGLQVAPTFGLGGWFAQRAANMSQGIGAYADPLVDYQLAGPANGKPGFYNWDYHNFSPRIAFAYSPGAENGFLKKVFGGPGKSSIRAGFGVAYDRIGQGLIGEFNHRGSFGMSTTLTSPDGGVSLATAPRLTDIHTIPTSLLAAAPQGQFPVQFPSGSEDGSYSASTFGLDSSIKTPYSYMIDFSVERDLGHNFTLDVSYVGHLSHRLLALEDLAQPANLTDPKTGVTYYQAAQALAENYGKKDANLITPADIGPTAQYWYDMTQSLLPGGAYDSVDGNCNDMVTTDALQANYGLFNCYAGNESTAIQVIDQYGFPDPFNADVVYHGNCGAAFGADNPNCYVNTQYAALFAWRSIANASYHALQVNLRKKLSYGVQFDFNYTFSKSIDLESDAERVDVLGSGSLGLIQNAWDPQQDRAVSDFDTPHQFNADWVIDLPFGKGKKLAATAHGFSEALVGGWQLSGLARWTSGFPVGIGNGAAWPTNWDFTPNATQIAPVKTKTTKVPGAVLLFPDPATALQSFRQTYPGQSGSRNTIRGDGYAGLDMGLSKRWVMPWAEGQSLQFRWEVFNVLNLTRFDVQSVQTNIDEQSFGHYTGLLTNPRVMQFALRYEF